MLVTCGEREERFVLPRACAAALARAGALPLLLPPVAPGACHPALLPALDGGAGMALAAVDEALGPAAETALAAADGLFLSGGYDIDPRLFGEEPVPALGRLEPDRDLWEVALVRAALRRDMPVLAVCRGMQLLNVAAGGTMYQDLAVQRPGSYKHFQDAPGWWPTHAVRVEPGSLLAGVLGRGATPGEDEEGAGKAAGPAAPTGFAMSVNSFHHQAVREPGPGLRVVAVAPDGVIEAVESPGHRFVLGVQWHPELMRRDRLVAGFVSACRPDRARRRPGGFQRREDRSRRRSGR